MIVDPFDTLSLSPDLDRAPIEENQRYTYPALAQKPRFDSAVIGTSTSRLLDPACLDDAFGASFVNLAMNSAEAWEQAQILRLFLRHHEAPRVLVMGLDGRWLDEGTDPPRTSPHYVFPPWLYDDDPVNDYLHLFDRWTVERARRQLGVVMGWREPKYGRNGYRDFLPDFGAYDAERARTKLYAGVEGPLDPVARPYALTETERQTLRFPTQQLFRELVDEMPDATEKVFFFPPYHHARLGRKGARVDVIREYSKSRIARILEATPGARLLDFQIRGTWTREDRNFWDPVHVTQPVAEAMCRALAASREEADGADASGLYVLRVR